MMQHRRICVFCGSQPGTLPLYAATAYALGQHCAQLQLEVVYGGAQHGVMGALAAGALDAGGTVIGVMPAFLRDAERQHPAVRDIRIVESMHARKTLMVNLADAFMALPGGFGTLDELFEIITWASLKLHHKPIGLLNVQGYFNSLWQFLGQAQQQGFISATHLQRVQLDDCPKRLVAQLLPPFETATVTVQAQQQRSQLR